MSSYSIYFNLSDDHKHGNVLHLLAQPPLLLMNRAVDEQISHNINDIADAVFRHIPTHVPKSKLLERPDQDGMTPMLLAVKLHNLHVFRILEREDAHRVCLSSSLSLSLSISCFGIYVYRSSQSSVYIYIYI